MPKLISVLSRKVALLAVAATAFATSLVDAQGPPIADPLAPPAPVGSAAPNGFAAPPRTARPSPAMMEPEPLKPGEAVTQLVAAHTKLTLITLESEVVELPQRIKIVDGHNPDVVSIMALSPNQLRIRAEAPGVTLVKLIDEQDAIHELEILVETDTRELEAYLRRLFPGSAIEVYGIRDSVVLRGWVTDPTHIPRIINVAETFVPKVHNQLDVAGTNQVQLHVKIIEVQRSKLRELGFNFVNSGQSYFFGNSIGGLSGLTAPTALNPGVAPITGVNANALSNSELLFGVTGSNNAFQGFVKALQTEALAKVLAEPVLVTTSGRPASMLSGGQFPVLIPSGTLGTATIQWREFGVRLDTVPIVLGNGRLKLDVSPEVSDRDFSSGVSFNGLVVPGIATRKVNTQVEMRFGETLMIGGLISTRRNGTTQKVPLLGELPFIGAAFSRKKYEWAETELLILVTPHMASPLNPNQVPELGPGQLSEDPIDRELYSDGLLEIPRYSREGDGIEYIPQMDNGYPIEMTPGPGGDMYSPGQPPGPEMPIMDGPGFIEQTSGTTTNNRVQRAEARVPVQARAPVQALVPVQEGPDKARRRALFPTSETSTPPPGLIGPGSR